MSEFQVNHTDSKQVSETVMVEVSKDKMLGVMWFEEPQNGGALLTLDQVKNEIARKGIKAGIDEEMVQHAVNNRRYNFKYIIAKGVPAHDGTDAITTLTFDADAINNFRPRENKDGTVDFKDLNVVHNVKKGDVLATKTPATEGANGFNVLDQAIKAKKGKDSRLPKGKNTEMSADGLTLTSSVDGKLEYDGHNIYVNTVYNLNGDLDSSIGNIDFVGSVSISGSVKSGFTIKAAGSVEVRGSVEDAVIIAGGDIFLSYGIQGIEKGKLVCGGNVIAKFIQNATVEAQRDVITEAIIHSNVSAGGNIRVESGKGTIVGGTVSATNMIVAKSIGSPMGTATSVQIGIMPSIYQKVKDVEKILIDRKKDLEKVDQSIRFLVAKSKEVKLDAQKQMMLQKFVDAREPLMEEIEKLTDDYKELNEMLKEAQNGYIKVTDTIHSGVKIVMGTTIKYLDHHQVHCTVRKSEGEIVFGA